MHSEGHNGGWCITITHLPVICIQSPQGTLALPFPGQKCTTVSAAVYSRSCLAGWRDAARLMNKNTHIEDTEDTFL